ncbi:polysaccharide biosynthesis protein [Halobacillus sp. BBL2006]|uniref:putative polysaccharide biosynthesis protein n=1 Tax=Halobacillus sp. BBL2006 TaxID=1543706 RepID=UPI000541CAE8|nr:polysaccharide biosynthesis protein [Halobacillus sp. BBL2006]KHE71541.1 polysaccharide biosynthesis/transport protein [Halobacillus sp. BBL2006]
MSRSTLIKGTILLSGATLLSKFLGAIFRIPLQNIAGDEVLGIFSMVYPVYMVALILSVAGIPLAISKLIAEARSENHFDRIKEIYITASILAILFGLTSFLLIYTFAESLASLLGGESTKLALIIVSATLLFAPYMAVYRGFFQGFETMQPTAISQLIEQFVRVALILAAASYFVVQGYSDRVIAGGTMVGSSIGVLASLGYLRWTFQLSSTTPLPSVPYDFTIFRKRSRQILKVSIPIAVGAITMALMNVVDALTIPYGLRSSGIDPDDVNYAYGLYGRGLSLVQIATVFATSIVLPLVPLITKKLAEGDKASVQSIVARAFSLTHIISWPAATGILALTLPLNLALFTNLEGSLVLAVVGFSSIYTSLAVLSTGILQGMNRSGQAAILVLTAMALKLVANIVLIQSYGLAGAAIATLVIYIVLHYSNVWVIKRKVTVSAANHDRAKSIISSVIMGIIVAIPLLIFNVEAWTRLEALVYVAAAVVVGGILYLAMLWLMKVSEVKNLPILKKLRKR